MIFSLRIRDCLLSPGSPHVCREVLDSRVYGGRIKVLNHEKFTEEYIELDAIRNGIANGTLILDRPGSPRVSIAAQSDDLQLLENNRFFNEVLRKIHKTKETRGLSFAKAYKIEAEKYAERGPDSLRRPFPSRAAMYRYVEREIAGLPLLRGNKNKGRRDPRYSEDVVSLICDAARDFYLKEESRVSVDWLTDHINREISVRKLHIPYKSISKKFVKATIHRVVSVDPERDRMDPKDAIAARSIGAIRIRVERPFERVEQDALHLPFVALTPEGISRDIWATLAVCCATGYPVGWHIVIGPPTERDALLCIESYMTPIKAERFEALGINHCLNPYAAASQIIFDNGSENRGERIYGLTAIGIDVKHCKAREAQGKPFIERLNRSVKEALQELAGCTRKDGKDGIRDPVALGDELKTVEEVELWVVRWLYERWVHTPLERHQWDELLTSAPRGKTPAERWTYLTETMGYPVPLPPSRTDWVEALYIREVRTLNRKSGITLPAGDYKGENLDYLVDRYGDHAVLTIRYDPDDFRQIYVRQDDPLYPLVPLRHEFADETTPAWSMKVAQEKFSAKKAEYVKPVEAQQFDDDLHQATVIDARSTRGRRRGTRAQSQETTRRAKEAEAYRRAADKPIPPSGPDRFAGSRASAFDQASAPEHPPCDPYGDVELLPVLKRK